MLSELENQFLLLVGDAYECGDLDQEEEPEIQLNNTFELNQIKTEMNKQKD